MFEDESTEARAQDTENLQEMQTENPIADPPAEEPQNPETADAAAPQPISDETEPEQSEPQDDAYPLAVLPPKKPKRNIAGTLLLAMIFLAVVGFSVYCIVWDVKQGTPSGGYRAGDVVQVNIVQQRKPAAAEPMTDASGRLTTAGIAEAVMPSIVEIYTYKDHVTYSSGSGILISEDGFLVTNAHVVAEADEYRVTLADGKIVDGVLRGYDSKTDIAVMKIPSGGLQPAILGNSDDVQLGEEVCALGSPAGLTGSISAGIISGLHRKIQGNNNGYEMDCLQTDAPISSGNSGGALVNRYGQVIGITSSKYVSNFMTGVNVEGVGFAISINDALPIIKELLEKGYVAGRVRIGISFYEAEVAAQMEDVVIPKEFGGKGVLVMSVDEDSDLAKTTFKVGDWIVKINGRDVWDYDSVCSAIHGMTAGEKIHAKCANVDSEGNVTYYEIDFSLLADTSGDY